LPYFIVLFYMYFMCNILNNYNDNDNNNKEKKINDKKLYKFLLIIKFNHFIIFFIY